MNIKNMLGYKLFKNINDKEIDLVRIIGIRKYKGVEPEAKNFDITVRHEGNQKVEHVKVKDLEGYTPLEPDGICTFNTVGIMDPETGKEFKDVIVTASKFLNIKVGDTLPYAVCRQNITDIFYNLLCKTEDDMMVGLSVNRDSCPANFDYGLMLACNEIIHSDYVNFYRMDTLEEILSMVKTLVYDTVLQSTYKAHVEASKDPSLEFKKRDKGWCKNLKTLLYDNNFQEDINQMLGITELSELNMKNHLVKKYLPNGEEYDSMADDLTEWVRSIFKINIKDNTVLEYDLDINLAEFNNARYFIFRDKTKKLFLVVYTIDGEYKEAELEQENEKKSFSDEYRIKFYNKYNSIKK